MDENKEVVTETNDNEVVNTNNNNETVNEEVLEEVKGQWDFAKKWLVVCGILLLILIALGITLYFVETGDLWGPGHGENEVNALINLVK